MFHTEALRLEELLADHGVAVRVGQASISADSIRFPLQLGLGTSARRLLGLSEKVARAAGYSCCRLRREGRTLFLELPREEGAGLRYGDLLEMAGHAPADGALLGLLDGGGSLSLRMTSPAVRHLLVTGEAGVGKSELLRVMALGLASSHAARHWRLALLEGRTEGPLVPLRQLPHCWAWSERPEPAVGWLVRLLTEMVRRERSRQCWPRVLAIVDDAEQVMEAGDGVITRVIRALLKRGAAVGIHLALACRETGSLEELLPLFPVRLQSQGPGRAGRFFLQGEEGSFPIMAARLDNREVEGVIRRMRARRPRVVARLAERSVH